MQVIEQMVYDQTILTAYQSYVEANFVNDMMCYCNEVSEQMVCSMIKNII